MGEEKCSVSQFSEKQDPRIEDRLPSHLDNNSCLYCMCKLLVKIKDKTILSLCDSHALKISGLDPKCFCTPSLIKL